MKKIEITTAQNVTIQYALASPWERGLALLIDVGILFSSALVLWLTLLSMSRPAAQLLLYVVVVPVVLLYSLAFEHFNNGRSPGKAALQLRVVRIDGRTPIFTDYLMRWCFRALDIYFSAGSVAILSIISTRHSQRIGDLLANTVVVNVGKSDRVPLKNLLSLERLANHKIIYPGAGKLKESTALLIKETLDRQLTIDNEAHREALLLLSGKVQRILKVPQVAESRVFLQNVLSDYVVLTR